MKTYHWYIASSDELRQLYDSAENAERGTWKTQWYIQCDLRSIHLERSFQRI